MHFNPEEFGRAMGEAIAKAVAPLNQRIAELEKQLSEMPTPKDGINGKDGAPGAAGKDCDMEAVKALVTDLVKAIPAPVNGKDGADGKDGTSLTMEDVRPILDEALKAVADEAGQKIDAAIKSIPAPKDGVNGKDGTSITLADVQPVIEGAVKSIREESRQAVEVAVKSIPAPKDGRDGKDGENGKDGINGEKGADGAGVADLMIDRAGELVATMTDGRMKNLGPVIGKDGRDGVDGKDGLSLDLFEMEYLDETHELRIKAACGNRVKEVKFPAGGIRPGGYWREGTKAKSGEVYTLDGTSYVAKCDTLSKPDGKGDWIILSRKGRDGETIVKTVSSDPPKPIKLNKDDKGGDK